MVRSKDLTTAVTLGGGAMGCVIFAGRSMQVMERYTKETLYDLSIAPELVLGKGVMAVVHASLPTVIGATVCALLVGLLQSGWPPPWKTPGFDVTKLFSFAALSEMFSPKAALKRFIKSTAQVGVVTAAVIVAVIAEIDQTLHSPILDTAQLAVRTGNAILKVSLYGIGALLTLAVIDYGLTFREHAARLRMTPEEWKREHRESEGDPHIKRRRKQRMRELARRRVAEAVRGADVVIVNPTEYAVALRYDKTEDRAPRVVAKGKNEAAAKIRELAREAGIPIIAEPPLCRLIHKVVKEGQEIPPKLYNAVATILAYVYKLKHRRG
jgi:flagellar biosynthesis protein FlhB